MLVHLLVKPSAVEFDGAMLAAERIPRNDCKSWKYERIHPRSAKEAATLFAEIVHYKKMLKRFKQPGPPKQDQSRLDKQGLPRR